MSTNFGIDCTIPALCDSRPVLTRLRRVRHPSRLQARAVEAYICGVQRGCTVSMQFTGPHGSFEVPDDWLREAGADGFAAAAASYVCMPEPHAIAAIETVEPPRRTPGVLGLHRGQMVSVMRALVNREALPPVPVETLTTGPFCYMLRDGFHRYHASIALGYTHLPVQAARGL